MATILPNGVSQFIDGNGNPLAGGTVTFYIPNTTTPKDTWQDAGQTTLNNNPLTLDSSGEAIVYGSGTYRQIVKNAVGTIIWDQLTASTASSGVIFGGTSAGTVNAQTISASAFNGTDGSVLTFYAGLTNTSALTLTIGVSSPIPVIRDGIGGPVALTGSEIVVGNAISLIYDAGRGAFHLIQTVVSAIGQAVGHAADAAAARAVIGAQPSSAVLTALSGIGTAVQGDVIYASGAGTWARLANGAALSLFRINAGATAPEWATIDYGAAIAALSAAAIGTHCLVRGTNGVVYNLGQSAPGSALVPDDAFGDSGAPALSGTWRILGTLNGAGTGSSKVSLAQRIA